MNIIYQSIIPYSQDDLFEHIIEYDKSMNDIFTSSIISLLLKNDTQYKMDFLITELSILIERGDIDSINEYKNCFIKFESLLDDLFFDLFYLALNNPIQLDWVAHRFSDKLNNLCSILIQKAVWMNDYTAILELFKHLKPTTKLCLDYDTAKETLKYIANYYPSCDVINIIKNITIFDTNDTLLLKTIKEYDCEFLSFLIQFGVDINEGDDILSNPLATTLRLTHDNNSETILTVLMDNGADINKKLKNNMYPLFAVCGYQIHDSMIMFMINRYGNHIDHSLTDSTGNTLAMSMAIHKPIDIDKPIRISASNCKSYDLCISNLISTGYNFDPNHVNESGNTLLMLSIQSKITSESLLDILLDKGADVNIENTDGDTAMYYFVIYYYIIDESIFKKLLDHQNDINKLVKGMTLLDYMVLRCKMSDSNNINLVHILLDYGMNPNMRSNRGYTNFCAYMCVHYDRNLEYLIRFINLGGDLHCTNKNGVSPLSVLRKRAKSIHLPLTMAYLKSHNLME